MGAQYRAQKNCAQNTDEPKSIDPATRGFNIISRARWNRETHSAESKCL